MYMYRILLFMLTIQAQQPISLYGNLVTIPQCHCWCNRRLPAVTDQSLMYFTIPHIGIFSPYLRAWCYDDSNIVVSMQNRRPSFCPIISVGFENFETTVDLTLCGGLKIRQDFKGRRSFPFPLTLSSAYNMYISCVWLWSIVMILTP